MSTYDENNIPPLNYFALIGFPNVCLYLEEYAKEADIEKSELSWLYLKNNISEVLETEYVSGTSVFLLEKLKTVVTFILATKEIANETSQMLSAAIGSNDDDDDAEESTAINKNVEMDEHQKEKLACSIRNYYCKIMNSILFTNQEKINIIYVDLVIPQLMMFENMSVFDTKYNKFEIKYSYDTPVIHEIFTNMLSCGRIPMCNIKVSSEFESVSRCQFFVLKVKEEYFVLSGWSCCGTRCISSENKKTALKSNQSFMRFAENETFVLEIGDPYDKQQITFNPKECVVCMTNKCEIRGSCKHATLCRSCYNTMMNNNSEVSCPICRSIYVTNKGSLCVATYLE